MINNQQLIVLMPCFDLQMPANVQMLFNQINKIASFDIIDIDPLINKVLNLKET
jgi:sialic acid synthase SpsE